MSTRRIITGLATLALATFTAGAQKVPLHAAVTNPILNEYGAPLAKPQGELVQFLYVNSGVQPPAVDGQPHPNNPVVYTSRIGNGMGRADSEGKFSAAITPRPGGPIIARVFNAPTLEEASFYADSQPFTPLQDRTIFYPVLNATTNPLDSADDDGDGVHNSWEKSLGSDRNNPDTDGDGVPDGHEFRAGTGLTDADSFLAMVRLMPQPGGHLRVEWDAVPGKSYQVQFAAGDLAAPDLVFSNVNAVITAAQADTHTTMTNGTSMPLGVFRVRLVDD
ncbi:MAG TPA: hypothetical protein PKE12_07645 [Kiritimatiellia bacterium]|nr:hypothetical protein [Kiritimatiellia bacterium]